MRSSSVLSYVLSGTATLAFLAGCSAGSGTVGANPQIPNRSNSGGGSIASIGREAPNSIPGVTTTFISDPHYAAVYIYSATGTQFTTLTGFKGPQGLAVDQQGALYVADTRNSRVQVYAPPYSGAPTTLNDPNKLPLCVSVENNGNVATTTLQDPISLGAGSVSFFAKGATSPANIVHGPAFDYVECGAFDAHGNFYVDGFNSIGGKPGDAEIGEIVGGLKGTTIQKLTTNNALSSVGGLQVTTNGQIAVLDWKAHTIYTYAPPVAGSLGNPVVTAPLQGTDIAFLFAFTRNNASLITPDPQLDVLLHYAYPQGGAPLDSFNLPTGGSPTGVAVYPPEIP